MIKKKKKLALAANNNQKRRYSNKVFHYIGTFFPDVLWYCRGF